MNWNAMSLQRVVKDLERHGSEVWPPDALLFQGAGLVGAIRVVLSLKFQRKSSDNSLNSWDLR